MQLFKFVAEGVVIVSLLILVEVLKGARGLVVEKKVTLPVGESIEFYLEFGGLFVQVLILFSKVGDGLFIQLDIVSN